MLNRLLVLTLVATLGALTAVGCTDNSGNGNYNPDARTSGTDGGTDAAAETGDDGAAATDTSEDTGEDASADASEDAVSTDGLPGDASLD